MTETAAQDSGREAELQRRLAELSPQKRELLEQALLRRVQGAAASAIPSDPDRRTAPLSLVQELMWLVHELTPGTHAYNSAGARLLRGPLDVTALSQAIEDVVARHASLRTTFEVVDGEPRQVVHDGLRASIREVQLDQLPPGRRLAAVERTLQEESRRPFDLARPPLLRTVIAKLSEHEHALITVAHHIVWDGWSRGVFHRELADCYAARLAGNAPELAPLPLQYVDFAAWQREQLTGDRLEQQLSYWRQQLKGTPTLLALPTDRPRPPVQTYRGDRYSHWVDAQLLTRLKALAQRHGVTLFMTLLAAFDVLLARWSGQADVCVGTPIAGRNQTELEGLIGYFTNTVAIRIDLSDDPTFEQLMSRARDAALGAYAHQEVSFRQVVNEIAPRRDPSHSPIFQVLFVLQNATSEDLSLGGVAVEALRHRPGTAKFDFALGAGEHDGRLHLSFEYASDLFDETTVARAAEMYEAVLRAVVDDASVACSRISLVDDAERGRLTVVGQGRSLERPDVSLSALVADSAGRDPAAVAVVDGETRLTYRELLDRSTVLAGSLRRVGVRADDRVGLLLHRSTDAIIAMLGVLGAGAAYVPLDPASPVERLRSLAADASLRVLLCSSGTEPVGADLATPVLLVDAVGSSLPVPAPAARASGEDPAYVVYTSGSTGEPKGVVVPHRAVVNHALTAVEEYLLGPGDRVLQFAPLTFDISVEEIYGTLTAGATLVIRPPDLPLAGQPFLDWLTRDGITVLDLPTAFWHEWVADLARGRRRLPPSLRLVIVGGEQVQAAAYSTWRDIAGERVGWVNTYGPTEATVVASSYWPTPARRGADTDEVPIGRPLPNVDLYVVDSHGEPVPVGLPGELLIGGDGVASGYLNRPELTAERFLPDPHRAGGRLYRTGDRVRWLADGNLVFDGRVDDQVKVNGYRIEPAEVVQAIAHLPYISQAHVEVRETARGRELVAYCVLRTPVDEAQRQLRADLGSVLPPYLLPGSFVCLDRLPVTDNGKVDSRRLPAPVVTAVATAPRAPRDELERRMLGLWRELLGVPDLGVDDDFFDAGGQSLLAVRLFSLLDTELGVQIPVSTLVSAPTVAQLAAIARRGPAEPARGEPTWESLVPMSLSGNGLPLFLVHDPDGHVLLYRNLVQQLGHARPVYGLQSVGLDRRRQPLTTIPDMADHYIREIRTVQPRGPYLLGGFCFGGCVAVEMANRLQAMGETVGLVALIDSTPFGYRTSETMADKVRRRGGDVLAARVGELGQLARETGYNTRRRVSRQVRYRTANRFYLDRDRRLPRALRDVQLFNWMSAQRYTTPHYRGLVTLFVADDGLGKAMERALLWERAVEAVDVRRIQQADIRHMTLLLPPHVDELAAKLTEALDAAEADR